MFGARVVGVSVLILGFAFGFATIAQNASEMRARQVAVNDHSVEIAR